MQRGFRPGRSRGAATALVAHRAQWDTGPDDAGGPRSPAPGTGDFDGPRPTPSRWTCRRWRGGADVSRRTSPGCSAPPSTETLWRSYLMPLADRALAGLLRCGDLSAVFDAVRREVGCSLVQIVQRPVHRDRRGRLSSTHGAWCYDATAPIPGCVAKVWTRPSRTEELRAASGLRNAGGAAEIRAVPHTALHHRETTRTAALTFYRDALATARLGVKGSPRCSVLLPCWLTVGFSRTSLLSTVSRHPGHAGARARRHRGAEGAARCCAAGGLFSTIDDFFDAMGTNGPAGSRGVRRWSIDHPTGSAIVVPRPSRRCGTGSPTAAAPERGASVT